MTNHYVYAYVQAKGLKTIVHQKLLLCKTLFDHKKISINPSSCESAILQQLMQELKMEEIPRSAENDRRLLDKWKNEFFNHLNVDVSQFEFRDGLNNHIKIQTYVVNFVKLTA